MTNLSSIRCVGCEGGIPALSSSEIAELLPQLKDWQVTADSKWITKRFTFKNFYHTMAFVNAVAYISNQENHHPDMEIGYDYCFIKFMTHAVNGLTQNDFICAAKIDLL